jgi:two-component system, NarL family, sensor histidine kinase BarA
MLNSSKKRKFFHVSLIVCIILLQCLIVLFWYLESKNDERIAKINNDIQNLNQAQSFSGESNALLIKSQILYKDYQRTKSKEALTHYFETLNEINSSVGNLNSVLQTNFELKDTRSLHISRDQLDTIVKESALLDKNSIDDSVINKFNYQEILNSFSLDSIITRDSIARKGFFSRVFDAISGKHEIQKEKIEIIASYKYKDKLNSGEVKSQLEKILKDTDSYYKNQIASLKESYGNSDGIDSRLYKINDRLLHSTSELLTNYNNVINPLRDDSQAEFISTTENNTKQRNYLILILTLVMLVFSIILFKFTLHAFDLEKKLITSQNQILKNLEYKNKIMGMISHEVRSPLSIISLYCKMIVSKIKDSEIHEVFTSIQNTTSTLLTLTSQILDYSKNENSTIKLEKSKFYLKKELTNIIEPLHKLCVENENKFQWNTSIVEDHVVVTDVVKINQLFYNLVGNALKYTKNGHITIDTKTEKTSGEFIQFFVTVRDTGTGISEADVKHVFEEYYQGSNGLTSMGIGLGLKLCKEIVELFDGEISIQSELDKGTTVSFRIQLELA